MAFERVCSLSEVPDKDAKEMVAFFLEGWEVIVLRDVNGDMHAFDGTCPHEDFPLVDGIFDGATITCRGHRWVFDATNGRGINPPGCQVEEYPLKVEGDDVLVDLEPDGEGGDEVPVALPG